MDLRSGRRRAEEEGGLQLALALSRERTTSVSHPAGPRAVEGAGKENSAHRLADATSEPAAGAPAAGLRPPHVHQVHAVRQVPSSPESRPCWLTEANDSSILNRSNAPNPWRHMPHGIDSLCTALAAVPRASSSPLHARDPKQLHLEKQRLALVVLQLSLRGKGWHLRWGGRGGRDVGPGGGGGQACTVRYKTAGTGSQRGGPCHAGLHTAPPYSPPSTTNAGGTCGRAPGAVA